MFGDVMHGAFILAFALYTIFYGKPGGSGIASYHQQETGTEEVMPFISCSPLFKAGLDALLIIGSAQRNILITSRTNFLPMDLW